MRTVVDDEVERAVLAVELVQEPAVGLIAGGGGDARFVQVARLEIDADDVSVPEVGAPHPQGRTTRSWAAVVAADADLEDPQRLAAPVLEVVLVDARERLLLARLVGAVPATEAREVAAEQGRDGRLDPCDLLGTEALADRVACSQDPGA